MSIKLPEQALQQAHYLHTEHLSNLLSIGYIGYGFAGSEIALEVISKTNEYLSNDAYVEFSLFAIEKDIPATTPLFAKYSIMDIGSFTGVAIAIDLLSWQASLLAPTTRRMIYAYDILRFTTLKPNIIADINKSGAKILTRNSYHKTLLKNLGLVNIVVSELEYFDVEALLQIVRHEYKLV